jgi:hypothetical protein
MQALLQRAPVSQRLIQPIVIATRPRCGHYFILQRRGQMEHLPVIATRPRCGHYFLLQRRGQMEHLPVIATRPRCGHYFRLTACHGVPRDFVASCETSIIIRSFCPCVQRFLQSRRDGCASFAVSFHTTSASLDSAAISALASYPAWYVAIMFRHACTSWSEACPQCVHV